MTHTIETPVYINTRFNYFCDGCEESELTLENNKFYANDEMYNNYYVLTCEHYETCKRVMHQLRNMRNKDNETD